MAEQETLKYDINPTTLRIKYVHPFGTEIVADGQNEGAGEKFMTPIIFKSREETLRYLEQHPDKVAGVACWLKWRGDNTRIIYDNRNFGIWFRIEKEPKYQLYKWEEL